MMKKIAALGVGLWLSIGACFAQTSPNLTYGEVLTPAQWNSLFAGKEDVLGFTPLNLSGGVMAGRLVTAPSSSTTSGFNLTPGTAGASPANGDLWITAAGFFAQVNGVTIGPIGGATSSSFAGTSPITVSFPSGVVTYAFNFSVANTFLAQQTDQGATTTQPGWYTQITGDTVARVRIGLNSTDVPSLAFGPGNANRDLLLERAGPAALRLGAPDAAAPVAQTVGVQNVLAGTSNTAGAALTVAGSQGTGTGPGGDLLFKIAPAGSTGSAQNALATALHIYGTDGGIAIGASATDPGVGNLNLGGGALWNNGTAPTGTGAYVRSASPALSGIITGNFALSGNITLSGQAIHTGTSVPASAAGNTNIAGTLASVPTLTNTGQANLFNTTVGGAIVQGDGSTNDFSLYNKSGSLAFNLPTGTTVPQLPGLASGTCSSGLGLDASNNIIKDACPGAASAIQVASTTVTSGTTGFVLTNNAGVLGNVTIASLLTNGYGITISGTTTASIVAGLTSVTGTLGTNTTISTSSLTTLATAAMGTTGTFFCSGVVTWTSTSASDTVSSILTDGTTKFAGTSQHDVAVNTATSQTITGTITNPVSSILLQAQGSVGTVTGQTNESGSNHDTQVSCIRTS